MALEIIKKHYLAIILALLIGVATGLPQVLAIKNTPEFAGVFKEINNDESYYLARARDVVDGHTYLSNPFLYEHKEGEPFQVWLPDYILAKPLALLGISVPEGFLFYDFVLPAALALMTFAVLFLLLRSRILALSGTIFLNLHLFFFLYNRSPSPQFNFIFFLALLLSLLWYIRNPSWRPLVSISVFSGLLFYVYPYYWTFYVVLLVLYILGNWIWISRTSARNLALAFASGVIIGAPYLFQNFIYVPSLPAYSDSMMRLGLLSTHFPSGISIVTWAFVVFVLAFALWRLNRQAFLEKNSLLLLLGTLASVISVNQHLITGKNLEFSSHYLPLSLFWLTIAGFFFAVKIVRQRWPRFEQTFANVLLVITLILGASTSVASFQAQSVYSAEERDAQSYRVVFDWLNENGEKDDVVFSDSSLAKLIPIYTSLNVWYTPGANLFFVSTEELNRRFFINNYFEEIDREFILKYERAIFGTYYINRFAHNQSKNKLRKVFGIDKVEYERIPEREVERALTLAEEIKSSDFANLLSEYRADYLIWDRQKDPNWSPNKYTPLTPVFTDERFVIYQTNF